MPSLEDILRKTKSKSEQIKVVRKPPSIATDDRPYSAIAQIRPAQPAELVNKLNTNQTQTTHKADTNLTQQVNTNSTQTTHTDVAQISYQTQTQHKPNTKLNTPKTQSKHKVDTNLTQTEHVSTLIGVQRAILLFIFEECKKSRSPITEPLAITHIASGIGIVPGSIKTSVSRLCDKAFLKINRFKNGRGGWSVYEIPDVVYKELLQMETQHKLHTKQTQTTHKVDTKLYTEPNTSTPSSSSSLKDLKTTTTELNSEWNFDISPYARIGFTTSQIKQLASLSVISAAEVEQSLIEFSHDLDNNALPKMRSSKLNFLMGLLRSGHSYVSEGFKNEQDAAISEMARRAEAKRESALKAKFEAWEAGLSDEERKEVEDKLPTHLMVLHRTYGISNAEVRGWLFNYYLEKGSLK